MNFTFAHFNINVRDLERARTFYKEALGLELCRVNEASDGSFILNYLTDAKHMFELELTYLRDHAETAYELGENESHLCLRVDDFDAAKEKHEAMGCICFVNEGMGIYFIEDPDGYWIEIVPASKGL